MYTTSFPPRPHGPEMLAKIDRIFCFIRDIDDLHDERIEHERLKLKRTSGIYAEVIGTRVPEINRRS